jgi:hypothetical protein
MARAPINLICQIESLTSGQTDTYSPASRDARKVPQGVEFTTKLGTGFESAQFVFQPGALATLGSDLLKTMKVVGAGGFTAYEGRVSGAPRSSVNGTTLTSVGWWTHLRDKQFSQVYVDPDTSKWGGIPLSRQAALLLANFTPQDGASENGGIKLGFPGLPWSATGLPCTESWYTGPPGVNLASLTFSYARTNANWSTADANFDLNGFLATDDALASYDATSDLAGAASGTGGVAATVSGRRYAILRAAYGAAVGGADSLERAMIATGVKVAGDHGLSNIYASEVIKNALAAKAPLLNYSDETVEATTTEIANLVFDAGSRVEDVVTACNGLHLFDAAVWENRTFYWLPSPALDDYDWELSLARGDTFDGTGDQVDEDGPFNKVHVVYQDVSYGQREAIVGPDDSDLLEDTSDENPCVKEGVDREAILKVDFPTSEENATIFGAIYLSEHNSPNRQGTGSTGSAYVKDRSGAWQPAYKIRAGDRVKYTHEESVRKVHGTRYSTDSKTCEMQFDNLPYTLDAIFERLGIALIEVRG